jgi:hypothetical protein
MHHAITIGGHSLLRLFDLNSSNAVGIALRSHTPVLLRCVAVGTAVVLPVLLLVLVLHGAVCWCSVSLALMLVMVYCCCTVLALEVAVTALNSVLVRTRFINACRHARVAHSRHSVFPVPVGLSSNAFSDCRATAHAHAHTYQTNGSWLPC